MSYLVLARKWRPQSLKDLVGQEHVARTLSNAIAADRVHHAFLFTGARGVGKTSAARILAKSLNCLEGLTASPCQTCDSCLAITAGNDVDVIEIDGASNTGVDDVRELRENIRYMPSRSRYKVFIIDEVHMLSINAFNALLKTLEEPPAHAKFILATTEPHKIPVTIHSRCQRFDFRKIGMQALINHLRHILDAEGVQISDQSLALIARRGEGSMRDSLSTLDQVLAFCGDLVADDEVEGLLGMVDKHLLFSMTEAILERDSYRVLETVRRVDSLGYSYRQVVRELIELFRVLVVLQATEKSEDFLDITADQQKEASRLCQMAHADDLQRLVMILIKSEPEFSSSPFPRLALEMLLLRLARLPESRDIGALISQLDGNLPAGDSSSARMGARASAGSRPAPMSPPASAPAPTSPPLDARSGERQRNSSGDRPAEKLNGGGGSSYSPASSQPEPVQSSPPPAPTEPPPEIPAEPIISEGSSQDWPGFVRFVAGKKRMLGTNLEHAHLVKFSLPEIEIGYPPSSFHSEYVKDRGNNELILALGQEFFSREIVLKVKDVAGEKAPARSMMEERKAQEIDKKKTCEDEARNNPAVQSIVQAFSGEIVKIRPVEGSKPIAEGE